MSSEAPAKSGGGLKKTFGWVTEFLFSEEPAPPKKPARAPDALSSDRAAQGELAAASVPAINAGKIAAGALQLVGLDAIRTALCAEWEARRAKIHSAVEGVFRRRLDVTDAYYRVQGDNYLILFSRLNRVEAQFKARVISSEIQRLILGEAADGAAAIVTYQVTEIDRKLVLEQIHSLDELLASVSQAAEEQAVKPEPAPQRIEAEVAAHAVAGEEPLDVDCDFSTLFKKVSAEQYIKNCAPSFRPLFDVKTLKFGYFLTATTSRSAQQNPDDSFHLVDNPEELPALLDRFLLDASMMGLHTMLQKAQSGKIVIPITYETLASKQLRDAYFTRLKSVPPGLKGFIVFRISDIPIGIPPTRLAEIINLLKPLSAAQVLHVPFDPALLDAFVSARCPAFSADLPKGSDDAKLLDTRMRNFAKRASAQGAQVFFGGVNTPAQLRTALSAGASVIHGNAVSPPVSRPSPVAQLKLGLGAPA